MRAALQSITRLFLITSICSGCASTINVSSTMLTSSASLQTGKRSEVSHFTSQDYVVQLTDFSWPDVEKDGGSHIVSFKWFKDDKLVSATPAQRLHFTSTPYTLHTMRAAGVLGLGHFRVQTVVDDQVVSNSQFDVSS